MADTHDSTVGGFFGIYWQQIASNAYENSNAHGFEGTPMPTRIALMHSELSEALEADRLNDPPSEHLPEFTGMEEEFADTVLRIMIAGEAFGLRIPEAIIAKHKFNVSRPFKHGGKKY